MKARRQKDALRIAKLKYQADQLSKCAADEKLNGEKKCMQSAQTEFLVNQWKGPDAIIQLANGEMSLSNLKKVYKELHIKDSAGK